MAKEENLKPAWEKGESGNPDGRPKGSRNRSTIAREILSMKGLIPEKILAKMKEMFPEMSNNFNIEQIIYLQQAIKAITNKDTNAAEFIVSSGYGKASQPVEQTVINSIDLNKVPQETLDELEKHIDNPTTSEGGAV